MANPRSQFAAEVAGNIPLCREHYRLVLCLPRFPATKPGQFIQIACQDFEDAIDPPELDWSPGMRFENHERELAAPAAILRRPFSLAGRRDFPDHVELDIIHRVVGIGTHWLEKLKVNDRVNILGPLGNVFTPPREDETAIFVGGGVGIPPMLYLAAEWTGMKAIAFAGALTRDLLPMQIVLDASAEAVPAMCISEFARHGIPAVIATDDGSFGFRGFVTQALETWLDKFSAGTKPTLYTCGPEPMMKRVAAIAIERGLHCQVAVERAMACGMGTCQSCCIKVKKPDPAKPPLAGREWCYRLACTDGPIFSAAELLW